MDKINLTELRKGPCKICDHFAIQENDLFKIKFCDMKINKHCDDFVYPSIPLCNPEIIENHIHLICPECTFEFSIKAPFPII